MHHDGRGDVDGRRETRVRPSRPLTTGRLLLPVFVTPALMAACFSEHTAPSTGGEGLTVGNIFFRSNPDGQCKPRRRYRRGGHDRYLDMGQHRNDPA